MLYYDVTNKQTCMLLRNGTIVRRDKSMLDQLNDWCILCGSTLEGRIKATKQLIPAYQKVPIILSESSLRVYFPTRGIQQDDCVFLCADDILQFKDVGDCKTEILTLGKNRIVVDVERRVIKKQLDRSLQLQKALLKNHEDFCYFNIPYGKYF